MGAAYDRRTADVFETLAWETLEEQARLFEID